jgi:hypothetical protein
VAERHGTALILNKHEFRNGWHEPAFTYIQGMQSCRPSQKNAGHKRESAKSVPTEQMMPC